MIEESLSQSGTLPAISRRALDWTLNVDQKTHLNVKKHFESVSALSEVKLY